jgi:hypothetical protein
VEAQFCVNITLFHDSVRLMLGVRGYPGCVLAEFLRPIPAIENSIAGFPASF